MNLYLMRHGIAVTANQRGTEDNRVRPLTPKGTKRMRRAAKGLKRLGIAFDALLTSPLVRARQTATIVAECLGMEDQIEEVSELAPETSIDHLVAGLSRFQNKENLLLVGHNPLLSDACASLVTGRKDSVLEIELKKGGVCRIEIDGLPPGKPGTLHWLLTPKQLRLLGD